MRKHFHSISTPRSLNIKHPQKPLDTDKSTTSIGSTYQFRDNKPKSSRDQSLQRIKLPNSFYNDRKGVYLHKSQVMTDRSIHYQSKDISLSERKKYETGRVESIWQKRKHEENQKKQQFNPEKEIGIPQVTNHRSLDNFRKKYTSFKAQKYQQLMHGSRENELRQKLLKKQISKKNEQKPSKWANPFTDTNSFKVKFLGKDLVGKTIESPYRNRDPSQLKVLNLDRLFRAKDGVLKNVVPLPSAKLSSITSRKNMARITKTKDRIHDVIDEYNRLLRVGKLNKTIKNIPRIGVKGKQFTRTPTMEELMGLKLNPAVRKESPEEEWITQDIFTEHCEYYRKYIKKNVHLTMRLIAGLKQKDQKQFDLIAFTRFYQIFITKVAPQEEKVNFLLYFFVPKGQQKIQLQILKLILEIMCEQLPPISLLQMKTDYLTDQEKSKIFLEALHKVLFKPLIDDPSSANISRETLAIVLENHKDAVELLINLLQSGS